MKSRRNFYRNTLSFKPSIFGEYSQGELAMFVERMFSVNQLENLRANAQSGEQILDQIPVAYLVVPRLRYQWLICSLNENNQLNGMYKLNHDDLTVGVIDNAELKALDDGEWPIFNALEFSTEYPLKVFKAMAEQYGAIIDQQSGYRAKFQHYYETLVLKSK